MIKIEKLFIGNKKEAFIETGFSSGINIIFSNDNDKGKTIVMQSLAYALGNDPIFPGSFDYKNYYHIIDIDIDGKKISICRKRNSFAIKEKNSLTIYDNLADFRRFFNKNIFELPVFIKDSKEKTADLGLFIQSFFVGQDSRDVSKVFNSGYYNKDDFINMIFSMAGCYINENSIDKDQIKNRIQKLQIERKKLQKSTTFLNEDIPEIALINYTNNKQSIDNKMLSFEQLMAELTELKNERNRIFNRKLKNENLIKELRSLNLTIKEGTLKCLECNSSHVGYENSTNDFTFDVSDKETRKSILDGINTKVSVLKEELERIDKIIIIKQSELKELMADEELSIENLMFYKKDILAANKTDEKILKIDEELKILENSLTLEEDKIAKNTLKTSEVSKSIIYEMNRFYKTVHPKGLLTFNSLFTTADKSHSGSEVTLFYLSKLYSIAKNLNHPFPIIMDGFREGELSTDKENSVIEEFSKLKNQIIFSSTLKQHEYGKYDNFHGINKIDYSNKSTCHILNTNDLDEFIKKIETFSIYQ